MSNEKRFVVVEGAGTDNQIEVDNFSKMSDAIDYVNETYDDEEISDCLIDIMYLTDEGHLTTEF